MSMRRLIKRTKNNQRENSIEKEEEKETETDEIENVIFSFALPSHWDGVDSNRNESHWIVLHGKIDESTKPM